MEQKANAVYDMIVGLLNDGIPIDGIGFSCHFFLSDYYTIIGSRTAVIQNLQRFANLGLEIHISEVIFFTK